MVGGASWERARFSQGRRREGGFRRARAPRVILAPLHHRSPRPLVRPFLVAVVPLLFSCERPAASPTDAPSSPGASSIAFATPNEPVPTAKLPPGVRPVHYT